ncbi:hypothetical protein D3C86_2122510 [compost metagenome]
MPTGTSAIFTDSNFTTGTPSSSPVNSFLSIASWSLAKSKMVTTGASLPDAAMYLPSGVTSTPWGLEGVGSR